MWICLRNHIDLMEYSFVYWVLDFIISQCWSSNDDDDDSIELSRCSTFSLSCHYFAMQRESELRSHSTTRHISNFPCHHQQIPKQIFSIHDMGILPCEKLSMYSLLCNPYSPVWEQSYPMEIHSIHKYFGLWVCFVAPSHTSSWHSRKRSSMCIFTTTKDYNRDDDDNSITIYLGENFLKVFFCFEKRFQLR